MGLDLAEIEVKLTRRGCKREVQGREADTEAILGSRSLAVGAQGGCSPGPGAVLSQAPAFQLGSTKEEKLARAARITALPSKCVLTPLQRGAACGWLAVTLPDWLGRGRLPSAFCPGAGMLLAEVSAFQQDPGSLLLS